MPKIHIHVGGVKTKDSNQPFKRAVAKLNDALSELDIVVFKDKGSVQTYTEQEKANAEQAAKLILQARRFLG